MSCIYPKQYFHYGDIGAIEEEVCIVVARQNGIDLKQDRRMSQSGDAVCRKGRVEIRYSSLIDKGNNFSCWQWPFMTSRRKKSKSDYYILVAGGIKNRYFIIPRKHAECILGEGAIIVLPEHERTTNRGRKNTRGDMLKKYEDAWWILDRWSSL